MLHITCVGTEGIVSSIKARVVRHDRWPLVSIEDNGHYECKPRGTPTAAIVLFTSGSTPQGSGYSGVSARADPVEHSAHLDAGENPVLYSILLDWLNAWSLR